MAHDGEGASGLGKVETPEKESGNGKEISELCKFLNSNQKASKNFENLKFWVVSGPTCSGCSSRHQRRKAITPGSSKSGREHALSMSYSSTARRATIPIVAVPVLSRTNYRIQVIQVFWRI